MVALTRSDFYVSPLAASLGGSQRGSTSEELQAYYQSSSRQSLMRVPEMFGDFRRAGESLILSTTIIRAVNPNNQQTVARGGVSTQMLDAGGVSGLRIGENNHAAPGNRVWFGYNHFHNAFDVNPAGNAQLPFSPPRSVSLDRFLIGWERVFFDGSTSCELRLPLSAAEGISGTVFALDATPYRLESGSAGNLSVILKRLVGASDVAAASYGLGIELPTGSSSLTAVDQVVAKLDSNAVHLIPFLAMTRRWGERLYTQGFAQIDTSSSGNELEIQIGGRRLPQTFKINPTTLLQLDAGLGYWLNSGVYAGSPGVAIAAEMHYATSLNDPDRFSLDDAQTGGLVQLNSGADSIRNLLNSTVGLHAFLGRGLAVRSGISTPIRDERVFDTEVFFQVNRKW